MKERVLQVISQVMDVPFEQLTLNASVDTVEKWDSLQHLNLVLALEEEFNVSFSDQEIIEILNAEIILEVLKEKAIHAS